MSSSAPIVETVRQRAFIDTGPSENGWHAHEDVLMCDQYSAYGELGLVGIEREPLARGTLIHIALAHHYAGKWCTDNGHNPWDHYLTPEEAVQEKVRREAKEPLYRKWADRVLAALAIYKVHWENTDAQYTVETVEQEYAFPAGTLLRDEHIAVPTTEDERRMLTARGVPAEYTQFRAVLLPGRAYTMRVDLVLRKRLNRRVTYFDHKGTGQLGDRLPLRYVLSGQFLGFHWMGSQTHPGEFDGVVANLIGFRAPYAFLRPPPTSAPHALGDWPETVREAHRRRGRARILQIDPWHRTKMLSEKVCVHTYGVCDAFELCRWGKRALSPEAAAFLTASTASVPVPPPLPQAGALLHMQ